MSFEVRIQKRGLKLNLVADELAGKIIPEFTSMLADFTFERLQQNAPFKTGFLRLSIEKLVTDNKATIRPTAPYTKYIEDDTAPHIIRAPPGGLLCFESGGGLVFTTLVHHPGTKGKKFIKKTAQEVHGVIKELFANSWDEKISEASS